VEFQSDPRNETASVCWGRVRRFSSSKCPLTPTLLPRVRGEGLCGQPLRETGAYRNRTDRELLSNPPLVLKTRPGTSHGHTPRMDAAILLAAEARGKTAFTWPEVRSLPFQGIGRHFANPGSRSGSRQRSSTDPGRRCRSPEPGPVKDRHASWQRLRKDIPAAGCWSSPVPRTKEKEDRLHFRSREPR
jgi:hypothetical protein